jgi:multiple sugar transport system ATP-binding protein
VAEVLLADVTKIFGDSVAAVDGLSLAIEDGEFMVLVGPSGCGKSTVLRLVAGLEEVTAGEISIGGRTVTDLPPKDRDVAMVFQNYALYPHMTVEENLGFGLRLRRTPKDEAKRRVEETARILELDALLQRKPAALSGGQRQRVAMGRAMVREPKAFLMDEPLSNLDAKLRVQMRTELIRIRDRLRTTTIYVTHDQVEAMTLGDRVAVLKDGRLQQLDTPQALFAKPSNLFVAAFIGSPSMNLVEATVGDAEIAFAGVQLPLPVRGGLGAYRGRTVILGIRPSDFEDAALWRGEPRPTIEVVPEVIEDLGSEIHVIFPIEAPPVITEETLAAAAEEGAEPTEDTTALPLGARDRNAFVARVGSRSGARVREPMRLAIDASRLHVFDRATGLAIE